VQFAGKPENGQEIDGPGDGHLFDALVQQVLEPNPGRIVGRVRPPENDAVDDVADAVTQSRHQIDATDATDARRHLTLQSLDSFAELRRKLKFIFKK
jgi:hypothetical protein